MTKVIFFDVGGVLLKDDGRVFDVFDRDNNLEPDKSLNEWRRYLKLAHVGKIRSPEEFRSFPKLLNLMDRLYKTFHLMPGIINIIKELESYYRLGVISNFSPDLDNVLNQIGVFDLFEHVINSSLVGVKKPSHDIYSIACQKFNVVPKETILIDDVADNVEAARDFGMAAVLFTSSDQLRKELRARYIFPGD